MVEEKTSMFLIGKGTRIQQCTGYVMDLGQDYQYYQLWSDNKWLIQELIDNDDNIEEDNKINNESYK